MYSCTVMCANIIYTSGWFHHSTATVLIHLMFTVSHNEQMWSPKKNSWNCCEPQSCKCGQQLPCLEFQTSLADFSFLHVFPYNVSDNPHQSHLHYYLTVSTETLKNSLIQNSDLLLIIDKRGKIKLLQYSKFRPLLI